MHKKKLPMLVVSESHLIQSPSAFDRAWQEEASIVILPDRCPDEFWIHARLGLIEPDLSRGHLVLWRRGPHGRASLSISSKSRMQTQAQCLAKAQELDGIARVLITLPLSEPFALVHQWIWAMMQKAQRVQSAGFEAPDLLREELSSRVPTSLCLNESQALALNEHFRGQEFLGVKRVCVVHASQPGTSQPWAEALRELFPEAHCFSAQGALAAMSFVTLERVDDPRSSGCEVLPGVVIERGPRGQVEVRSRYASIAEVDDHALHRFGENHRFAWASRAA